MNKFTAMLLVLIFSLSCAAASAELAFTTGGSAGTYYAYGSVLAMYISDHTDLDILVQSGNGSASNIDLLDMDFAQLALVQNDIAYYAYNGVRFQQYVDNPVTSFTALAALYDETIHLVTCDPSIKSVADLKGKNVSVGAMGSAVYYNAMDILGAYDLTVNDFNPWYLSFGDSGDALRDGKITAAFLVSPVPASGIIDLCQIADAHLISIDQAHLDKLTQSNPFYGEATIPGGIYNGIDEDISTVAVKATIIANEQVTEDEAYAIVSTIFENKEEISELHNKGELLEVNYASSCGLPYHPGAQLYFDEKAQGELPEITGEIVFCPEDLTVIRSLAFADCASMKQIYIPESVTEIADNVFDGCRSDLLILGKRGSTAESFAAAAGYTFVPYNP